MHHSILQALFGERASEFAQWTLPQRHVVVHGSPERFPESMRSGDLSTFERLCQAYQGVMHMAGGEGNDYRMIRVQGLPPAELARIGLTVQFFNLFPSIPGAHALRAQLAAAFGLRSTDAGFLAYLDVNGDGRVNNQDLSAFAARFGTAWTGFSTTI